MADFAAGHVPGSLSNPLRYRFGVWLGWLVDLDRDIILVTSGDDDELDRAVRERLKVGHENLVGQLPMPSWQRAVCRCTESGCSIRSPLRRPAGAVGRDPVLTHCGHGERAMTAASVLARAGHPDVAVLAGGPAELTTAAGVAHRESS